MSEQIQYLKEKKIVNRRQIDTLTHIYMNSP